MPTGRTLVWPMARVRFISPRSIQTSSRCWAAWPTTRASPSLLRNRASSQPTDETRGPRATTLRKGDRHHLCTAPSGPFRQMVPVPFPTPSNHPTNPGENNGNLYGLHTRKHAQPGGASDLLAKGGRNLERASGHGAGRLRPPGGSRRTGGRGRGDPEFPRSMRPKRGTTARPTARCASIASAATTIVR